MIVIALLDCRVAAGRIAAAAVLLAVASVGSAVAFYPPDGSKSDGLGGLMNPADGMCVIGIKLDGTMLVDWSITNARDCVAWTRAGDGSVDLVSMTTQDACTKAGYSGPNGTNDGWRHAWSTSLCYDSINLRGISRVDLDNTDAMCASKGGTVVTTGKCVAYGWVYRNRLPDGTLPVSGTGIGTTDGVQFAQGLGFCATSMRMTSATYASASTCPSYHNSPTLAPAEWPACASSTTGCQTQASYNAGLGWSWDSANSRCNYSYGVKGLIGSNATKADGTTHAAGSTQDLTLYTNQGDCLANGFSWDNWLPNTATVLVDNATPGFSGIPAGAKIRTLDALSSIEDGGGEFYSGTGAVCLKCHSDQSRSYAERDKPGYVKTPHRLAGTAFGEPFQPFFTASNSDWGLDGVECAMCHSTAKPAQDDLIQVVPAGVVGPPPAGAPKSATGHNNTEYGTHLVGICYTCHGTAASPETVNPASVIPVAAGDLELTDKGLSPIANQFLNSPHAGYSGSSSKIDVGDRTKYHSTFLGYVCRSAATQFRSNAAPGDSQTNCQNAGHTWYTASGFGNFCYYNQTSCQALSTGQWTTSFSSTVYPWAAASGGPQGVCIGVGIGSILTTTYRNGEAEKIHNLDSTTNPACTNAPDGSSQSGAGGFWVKEGETSPGVPSDTTQGNCMTCHDVHWAFSDTNPQAEPLRRECTTCHSNETASASGAPQIDVAMINHLKTTGTPLENWKTNPDESCATCHMPMSGEEDSSLMHLWRISTDPSYVTMGADKVNLDGDGKAWVDVDHACGQCHGGGTTQDSEHTAVAPALYRTRAQLAAVAEGMHDAATVTYPVTFTTKVTGANVDVVAYVNCGIGVVCPAFTYDWDWGDGTSDTAGGSTSHTYAAAGKKTITLTLRLAGKNAGSVSRSVLVATSVDAPPVASASCTWNANTWTVDVTDTSTDTDSSPVTNVKVDWGDSTGAAVGGPGASFSHKYIKPSSGYPVVLTAIDAALQSSTITLSCTGGPVAPAKFTATGTVFAPDGTTPLAGASVRVRKNGFLVRAVTTDANGEFSTGPLKPANYKLRVVLSGYTFAIPAATFGVGPSTSGIVINAESAD